VAAENNFLLACVAFLVPALSVIEVHYIGRLFASEAMLLFLLPALILNRDAPRLSGFAIAVVALALVWLIAQVSTDLIRESAPNDYWRGWAKIGFTLTNFIAIYLLVGYDRQRLFLFSLGIVLAGVLDFILTPDAAALGDSWKFGMGGSITLLAVMSCCLHPVARNTLVGPLILLSLTAINLLEGFRSLAGICLITAVYLVLAPLFLSDKRTATRNAFCLLASLLIASVACLTLYGFVAAKGWLGEEARVKYEQEASGPFGVLIGGRAEVLASLAAISDSPVIGHGSWAPDTGYVALLERRLEELGYPSRDYVTGLIPTHSHLFGAWVEAGLFGVPFWLLPIVLSVRALIRPARRDALYVLIVFIAISLLWDVLFSPYGAERRMLLPYFLVLLIYIFEQDHNRATNDEPTRQPFKGRVAARLAGARVPTENVRAVRSNEGSVP
jgi:hypothetical protein